MVAPYINTSHYHYGETDMDIDLLYHPGIIVFTLRFVCVHACAIYMNVSVHAGVNVCFYYVCEHVCSYVLMRMYLCLCIQCICLCR